jgi:hypothetical protein
VSASDASSGDYAQTQAWKDEGTTLIGFKATASAAPYATAENDGAWAYQSDPVTLTADGEVTLNIRVPDSFTIQPGASGAVKGLSFEFPPDMTFAFHPDGGWTEKVDSSGVKVLSIPFLVQNLQGSYADFSVWIY